MSTTRVRVPALEALMAQVREIGGRYQVRIELPQDAVNKANWLADKDRDFFSVTPSLQASVAQACVAAVRRGGLAAVLDVAPEAIRVHIVRRFEAGGYDMRLRPLTPGYRAFKAKHGLDPRIGIATGALLAAVKTARIWLEKTG